MSWPEILSVATSVVVVGGTLFYLVWVLFLSQEARELRAKARHLRVANELNAEGRYLEAQDLLINGVWPKDKEPRR